MLNKDIIYIVFFFLPVYQLLFYSIQLVTFRKKNDPSRRPLGFFMLLMLLWLVINSSLYFGYYNLYSYLKLLQLPVLLAIIPTYYLYFHIIGQAVEKKISWYPLLYYFPSLIILLLNILDHSSIIPFQASRLIPEDGSVFNYPDGTNGSAGWIFLLGNYIFITGQLVIIFYVYRSGIQQIIYKRNQDPTHLPFLQTGWSIIITISVVVFVILCALMHLFVPAYNHISSVIFNSMLLISGGLTGYFSLKQDKLFIQVSGVKSSGSGINDFTSTPMSIEKIKPNGTLGNDGIEEKEIISQLKILFEKKKPYLNSDLNILDLKRDLGISKRKLTYIINDVMGTNFYGLINKYRVMEAREHLNNPQYDNYKIDAISEMVGFKSKTSFYSCFKKVTGLTPLEFRKKKE